MLINLKDHYDYIKISYSRSPPFKISYRFLCDEALGIIIDIDNYLNSGISERLKGLILRRFGNNIPGAHRGHQFLSVTSPYLYLCDFFEPIFRPNEITSSNHNNVDLFTSNQGFESLEELTSLSKRFKKSCIRKKYEK